MPPPAKRSDLLRTRLERFTDALEHVTSADVRGLHRTRVATRRLREVIPVLQIDADTSRKLGRRLRRVTKRLGQVRELDVMLLFIEKLAESGRHSAPALSRITSTVATDRNRARAQLLAHLPVTELGRLAAKLDKVTRGLEATPAPRRAPRAAARSWQWAIDARVARRASAVLTAVGSAGAMYLPERLHAVRIAVKKLRYALELAVDASGVRASADLRRLERTQETLGRLHDLQMLIDRVRQLQGSLAPPDLVAWRELDLLIRSLEDECRSLHGRYMHDRAALGDLAGRLAGRQEGKRQIAEGKRQKAEGKS